MKRLYRSRQYRVLGGVAAGTADYFGLDITLMRLLFALAGLVMPQVIIAYILAWVIIPEEPVGTSGQPKAPTQDRVDTPRVETPVNSYTAGSDPLPPTAEELLGNTGTAPVTSVSPEKAHEKAYTAESQETDKGKQFFGYLLIGIGLVALLRNFVPRYLWRMPFELMRSWWPIGIIALGLVLIFGAVRGR